MNRFFTILVLSLITLVFTTGVFAQQAEKPATYHPENTPEKFRTIQPIPNLKLSANAAWRSRPSGMDNPNVLKLLQDFESALYPPTGWTLEFTGTQWWNRAAVSGYAVGTGSSFFNFWSAPAATVQSLVTSTFAATSASDSLLFDYAQAYYTATNIDSLIIETSTNGGTTWNSLDRLFSSTTPFLSLSTMSTTSQYLAPLASEWGTKRYSLPVGTNKIRFMAKSGFGNNLYIDNIKVGVLDANDIAASAFISPVSGSNIPPNTTFTPSASFQNVGTATQTGVSVRYEIRNAALSVVYTNTQSIASLASGATTTVTFGPVSGGIASGNYTLRSVVVTPDANSANDTLNGTLLTLPPLTGTKTIGGTSPDYPTFTAAVTDLVAQGVGTGGVIFNVRPGSYPERFSIGPIAGASAANTILFKRQGGQVTVNGVGTAATNDAMILLNGCDWVTLDSIDVTDGGSSTTDQVENGYALQAAGGTDGANNNTIRNARILLGGGGTVPGFSHGVIISSVATSQSGATNNTKLQNLNIDRSDRGVGSFSPLDASNNPTIPDINTEVSGCILGQTVGLGDSLTGTGGSAIGIILSGTVNAKVFNNTLHSLQSKNAGSTAGVIGISCQVSSGDWYNNRILGIRHFGTTTTALTGGIQSGTLSNGVARIYNNFISNVTRVYTAAATATNLTYGIRPTNFITGSNGIHGIYYNSIFLNDNVGGDVAYSSAALLLFGAGLPVEARNNILVNNTATSSATAKSYAIVDGNATRVFLTSNNNNFNAGGTNGHVGLVGTATFQVTLANWQAATLQDGNSVNENPPFVNVATVPHDLHINSAVATRMESGGANVAGITTDIDGQPRVVATLAPNVAPDIGADEFSGIPFDAIPPSIAYSPFGTTGPTGNRTLAVTIKDPVSGVHVGAGFRPRLYFKKGGGSVWTSPQVDSAGVRVGDVWTFTINVTNLGGVVTGDTVYYYAAAADSSFNVATNPAGGSGLPPGSTPPAAANFYRVGSVVTGSMTIGASGATFATLQAAFDSINVSVVTGNVTLLINADYAGDTVFPISLNQASYGAGGPFTITLRPNTGATPVISGVSTTSIIKLNGADNVIIDGSNSGGTTRDLTITNTGTGANSAAIWLSSLGAGAGAVNNTIRNCNISSGVAQNTAVTATFGIVSTGLTIGTTVDGFDNDNNTFLNNAITKVRFGIFVRGAAGAVQNTNDNNVISQNIVGPAAFGPDEIGAGGIIIQHQTNATVTQNEVRFVGGTFANTSGGGDRIGIGVGSAFWTVTSTLVNNSTITRNLIHDIVEERTFSAVGIAVGTTGNPSSNIIANNMIYNVWANGTVGDQAVGIGIGGSNGDAVVYNSIFMKKDTLDPAGTSLATQSGVGIRVSSASLVSNLTLLNNIVHVDFGSRTATLRHFAIVAPAATYNWGTGRSNNNDLFVNAVNPQMSLGGIGTAVPYTAVANLTAWRTQFSPSQDGNSISAWAGFADTTSINLHINPLVFSPVNNAGTPVAGVTVDYDGQTRSVTTPDIGADEYTPIVPVVSNVVRSTRVPNQGDTLVVTCTITDSLGIATANLLYASDDVAQTPVAMTRTSGTATNGAYRGVIPASANLNGRRIEYQVQGISSGGNSTTTAIGVANAYYAGISPLTLTGVRRMNASGKLIDTLYYARVTGTVSSPNFTVLAGRLSYTFQDAFGGMNVNRAATLVPALNIGDSIIVVGRVSMFRGTTQITPDTVAIDIQTVATGRPVPVADVTVNAFNANPERYESILIRMTSLLRLRATPVWGTNVSIPVYQGIPADSTLMFIDADTPVPAGPEPTYPVTVTGVGGQFTTATSIYNNGYQIIPRSQADFASPISGLSGTYTIGTTGNFPTLSRAIFELGSMGVVGPVTFLFIDPSYTDTAQIILPYAGQGAANPVTFRPASGVTPRIFISGGSTVNAGIGIRMDSVSHVVWNGSNSGGTDRSLTIDTDTNTTTARTPILIRKGSRNVTLRNMIIRGNRHSVGGIPSVVVIDNTGFASSGGQHNMTVDNCQLMRGNNGLFVNAASGAVRDSNHTFINNLVGGGSSASVFDHLAAAGITMTGNHNVLVDNNDVNGIKVAGTPVGIRVNGANTAVRVTRNRIRNLVTLSGAFRPLCFLVGNIITTGPGVRTRAVFANNMIFDIHNFGTGGGGRAVNGLIYNPTGGANSVNGVGSTIEWYYNSWNIDFAAGEGTGNTAFLFDGNFAGSNPNPAHSDSIRFFNNVGSIKRADSLAARMFLLFGEAAPGNLALQSDNNVYNYYVGPFAQIPSPWPGGTTAVFPNTLQDFRDSTGLDINSAFGDPRFVGPLAGHISPFVPTPVESRGQIIAGITTDFDNDIRFGAPGYLGTGTAPDAGADEGNFLPPGAIHDIGVVSVASATADAPLTAIAKRSTDEFSRALAAVKEGTNATPTDTSPMLSPVNNQLTFEMFADEREQVANNEVSTAYLRSMIQSADQAGGPVAASVPASQQSAGIISSAGPFSNNAPINFKAIVRNYGAFIEPTYQVGWTINGIGQTAVNNTRSLAIGGRDTLTLTWATPTTGQHVLRAFTILVTDTIRSNDTATFNFTVAPTGIVFEEGFNSPIPPYPAGWHVKNRDGGGTTTWFQGNPAVFPAYEGSGYIGANFNAANGLFIDEWLVTPNTGGLLANPNAAVDSLIFWQRSPNGSIWPDSIQIRVSVTDTAVASFNLVLDYFKVDTIGWRRKAYALPTATNRYIAFRYLIYNGGAIGANSNYLGIDAVQIKRTTVTPPGFFDDFEAYTAGLRLVVQNPTDWTTWSGPSGTAEDPFVSSAQAFSGTKSVVIVTNNDLVKRLGNDTTGVHEMSFRFYIPTGKAGYFNTLATFAPPTFNWAMESYFDSTGNGRLFVGSATAVPFTYTRNAWQTATVVVNLTIDSARFVVNGNTIRTWRWTAGASGGTSPRRLAANNFYGATAWDQMYVDDYRYRPGTWTGVGEEKHPEIPETFVLMQNYPNPFNPTTTIRYALPEAARVTLSIYNILGQRIAELTNDVQGAGYYNVLWNGRNQAGSQVATGVYLYRIEAVPVGGGAPFINLKKMLLVK